MKIMRSHLEVLAFLLIYIFALYLWTQPFQDNRMPYGEFDAISHWELADTFATSDRTFVTLPGFIDFSYGDDNRYKPGTLWYHPPFHLNMGIVSAFNPERVLPVYFTNAVFATAILFSIFFVIRKLYGFLPAFLSSFLIIFSMRDITPYLWGQWPERFGYAFIPLVLYCFYKYYTTYSKEESKPIYLYLMGILLAVELMIHPLSFFHTLITLAILGLFLLIKEKKLPFNIKHIGICAVLFLLLFAVFPYQSGNILVSFTAPSKAIPDNMKVSFFERVFSWSPNPIWFKGSVPDNYFSFNDMHGFWTLPFLLFGILILAIRREKRDLFLLAWLISLYIILHRDLYGKFIFLHRSLSATAHIFAPITAIGILSIASFLPLKQPFKKFSKYGLAALFIIFAMIYNFPAANSTLENAYNSPILRLNGAQIEVSEWLLNNIDEDQNVSIAGPPGELLEKVWWMASISHRTSHFFEGFLIWRTYEENREETIEYHLRNDYIVFDYSDIALISDRSFVERWQAFEQQFMGNHTLVYNKNNIRVYIYEPT